MAHYYLAQWQGSGTDIDPFKPIGLAPGVAATDLRPDCTRVDGYALLSMAVRNDQPKNYYCGNDLDGISPAAKNRLENALGITLVSNSFRDIFYELFDPLAGHAKPDDPAWWKPLTLTTGKAWELYLNGELIKKVQVQGGGVTDNFNRADENPLASPWAGVNLGGGIDIRIASNAVTNVQTSMEFAYHTTAASTADQYSQWLYATAFTGPGTHTWGPAVRVNNTSGGNGYWFELSSGAPGWLQKMVNGTKTTISNPTWTPSVGSTWRIEVSGSSIAMKKDGTAVTGSPQTDTAVTTGAPGVFIQDSGGSVDDFDGGDLVSAVSSPMLPMGAYQAVNRGATF